VGTVTAEEFMDDGTPIRLAITIDRAARTALLDFTGGGAHRTHRKQFQGCFG
jgi:5-oxoprolinase (ATP-hydrolysing)